MPQKRGRPVSVATNDPVVLRRREKTAARVKRYYDRQRAAATQLRPTVAAQIHESDQNVRVRSSHEEDSAHTSPEIATCAGEQMNSPRNGHCGHPIAREDDDQARVMPQLSEGEDYRRDYNSMDDVYTWSDGEPDLATECNPETSHSEHSQHFETQTFDEDEAEMASQCPESHIEGVTGIPHVPLKSDVEHATEKFIQQFLVGISSCGSQEHGNDLRAHMESEGAENHYRLDEVFPTTVPQTLNKSHILSRPSTLR